MDEDADGRVLRDRQPVDGQVLLKFSGRNILNHQDVRVRRVAFENFFKDGPSPASFSSIFVFSYIKFN